VRLVPALLKTNWLSGSQAGPLFLEETFAARLLQVEEVCVSWVSGSCCFFLKVTELRRMFGVFYSGFSHCTASFPEVYDIFSVFHFFLGHFFRCNLVFLGGWGDTGKFDRHGGLVLHFKIDRPKGDKGGDRLGSTVFVDR